MRRFLIQCALVCPGIFALAAVAHRYHGADKGLGAIGLAVQVYGLAYLALCMLVRARERIVARVALAGWAILLSAGAAYAAQPLLRGARPPDYRAQADSLDGLDWEEWFAEFGGSYRMRWESYVYWRRVPHAGKHIHVADNGLRRTWNARATGGDARRIFLFGGSTMWGFGARDDETIASLVSRRLHDAGHQVEVQNWGETAYVSTQGLIALMLELRRGNVPDVVVFYDGVNDIYTARQNGEAGIPLNEWRRRAEFERSTGMRDPRARPRLDPGSLAGGVVDRYLGNLRILEALAARFGFRIRCYWQPCPFVDKPLTPYEREAGVRVLGEDGAAFFRECYRRIRERPAPPNFRDLSAVFAGEKRPRYLDWCHLTAVGNGVIADEMIRDLEPVLEQLSGN